MAFRAKTFTGKFNEDTFVGDVKKKITRIEPDRAPDVTIDGETFTSRFRLYKGTRDRDLEERYGIEFGVPTAAQLAHPNLMIETLCGRPWPGSAYDRNGKGESQDRTKRDMQDGAWPDDAERRSQRNAHFRFHDAVAHTKAQLAVRGTPEDSQEGRQAIARAEHGESYSTDHPDLGAMPPMWPEDDEPAEAPEVETPAAPKRAAKKRAAKRAGKISKAPAAQPAAKDPRRLAPTPPPPAAVPDPSETPEPAPVS